MITMCVKDEFRCVALDDDELELFFQAKHEDEAQRLKAMKDVGVGTYEDIFRHEDNQSLVLLDPKDDIIGSAEVVFYEEEPAVAHFEASHIHLSMRRKGLSSLLYGGCENFVKSQTDCSMIELRVNPEFDATQNNASQKAARRNGFQHVKTTNKGHLVFEKRLEI